MTQPDTLYTIRRLPYSSGSGSVQLASSAAMLAGLDYSGLPALRWYRFAPPALVLGVSQTENMIDTAACAAAGVSLYWRRSGGGAVLCDETLFLIDLALPREHPLYRDDIMHAYRWIGEVWAITLGDLGLTARAIPVEEARADAKTLAPLLKRVCYGGLSSFETVVDQRKVVGLAQQRQRVGMLVQGGVYLHWEPARTAALMAASPAERSTLAENLAARVAGLDELLKRPVDDSEIAAHFEANLSRLTGLTPQDAEWNAAEQQIIEAAQ